MNFLMITSFRPSSNDLIEPLINTLYEITLYLYPAWNTGNVHTNLSFFYNLRLSR